MDEDDLLSAQQPLADGQGPDRIISGDPTGIADHVGIPFVEAEQVVDIQSSIHAGKNGHVFGRWEREWTAEAGGVPCVVLKQLVGDRHRGLLVSTTAKLERIDEQSTTSHPLAL